MAEAEMTLQQQIDLERGKFFSLLLRINTLERLTPLSAEQEEKLAVLRADLLAVASRLYLLLYIRRLLPYVYGGFESYSSDRSGQAPNATSTAARVRETLGRPSLMETLKTFLRDARMVYESYRTCRKAGR